MLLQPKIFSLHQLSSLLRIVLILLIVLFPSQFYTKSIPLDEISENGKFGYGRSGRVHSTHHSPSVNTLSTTDSQKTIFGCNTANLLDGLKILMCSNGDESYQSVVHYPTKLVASQLTRELFIGSISNPQAVNKISTAIELLNAVVKYDQLSLPNLPAPFSSDADNKNMIVSINELIKDYDINEKSKRVAVQAVSLKPSQTSVPSSSKPVLHQAPVLERPPLASSDAFVMSQSPLAHPEPMPNVQGSTDTTSFLSNNIVSVDRPDCATVNMASLPCSPVEVQNGLDRIVVTFANAILNINNARNMLLNNVVEASACSAPEVTGNQLGWASLGTSERTLIKIFSELLSVQKIAAKQVHDAERTHDASSNNNAADSNAFANLINGFLPDAPNFSTSSFGKLLSSAASSMSESNYMNDLKHLFSFN